MEAKRIGFIGLGLIGGSIAKGLKKKHPDWYFIGTDIARGSLLSALHEGVLDEIRPNIDEEYGACDLIFLCTPVTFSIKYLKELKPLLKESCILTDVGSTKSDIMREVSVLGLNSHFIGGHPMAGSEQSGYENSTDHLVENAYYVLTPAKETKPEALDFLRSVVEDLSALPLILDAKEHDYIVAAVSHLPHLIAAALVNLVKDSDNEAETMRQIAAGGFKDITRIASSSPLMWEQVCLTNGENIALILKDYISSMNTILEQVNAGDGEGIYQLFDRSREYRNSIPDKSLGPIKKQYALYCDIVDESGAIATIATILATHQINIKNIGILHNREFEEGVLKIEFYDEASSLEATAVLKRHQYTVHQR